MSTYHQTYRYILNNMIIETLFLGAVKNVK